MNPTLAQQYDLKWKSRAKTSNEPDTISLGIEQPGCLPQFLSRQRTWWPSRHFEQVTTTSRWSVSISNMTQHFHVCPENYTQEFITRTASTVSLCIKIKRMLLKAASQLCGRWCGTECHIPREL